MNTDKRLAHKELRLAEEAAEWLHRLPGGGSSLQEQYVSWLLESPRHVEAMLRVAEVEACLQRVDPDRTIKIERTPRDTLGGNVVFFSELEENGASVMGMPDSRTSDVSVITPPSRTRRWPMMLVACSALLGVLALGMSALSTYQSSQWQQYVTAAGVERSYTLSDGSLLQLAPGSRVAVRYLANERSLRLVSGEALFKVHHDTSRPFRVQAGGMVVEAVGTQFTVRQRSSEAIVSVLEGRVRVDSDGAVQKMPVQKVSGVHTPSVSDQSVGPAAPLFLSAGEQARVKNDGQLEDRRKLDPARPGWGQDHRLVFEDETLQSVVTEFNRFNPELQIKVDASGGGVGQYFTGSFDAEDPESLLAVLERNPALQVERGAESVVIRAVASEASSARGAPSL